MAQYTIKRITLPNGDVCTLKVEGMDTASMQEAVEYLALPAQYGGGVHSYEVATLEEAMAYLEIGSTDG